MRKISYMLLGLLAVATMFTSCLGSDDDDIDLSGYNDTAITAFSLSAVNKYTHTTSSSTGNDTVLKSTVTVASYPMSIDQNNRQIFNRKALPTGSDLKHVLVSVSARNSGVVGVKSLTSDSITLFSSTDSLDFSVPRTFRVFAYNGEASRDYTVTLTADGGGEFQWTRETDATQVASVQSLIDSRQTMEGWEDISNTHALTTYLGHATKEFFAMGADGRIKASTDAGASWTDELLDDDASLLPSTAMAFISWPYAPSDNTDYVLLVGTRVITDESGNVTGRESVAWRKISEYDSGKPGQWVYMPFDDTNLYALPRQDYLSLALYDGTVLALGSDKTIYQSRDQGITWKANSTLALPSTLSGTVAMTSDAEGTLWVVTSTGQVWKGTKD